MEKKILEDLFSKKLTKRKIAEILGETESKICYWLNYYELLRRKNYKCKTCNEDEPSKFLKGRFTACRKCRTNLQSDKHRKIKRKAVDYKGGKCEICGYKKCLAALDFHHLDPSQKDPNFNKMRSGNFETYKKELDKCILVCRNCHAEIHYGLEQQDQT